MCLPVFTSRTEDIPDLDEMTQKFKDFSDSGETVGSVISYTSSSTIGAYNERMMGVFQDAYDLNYIWEYFDKKFTKHLTSPWLRTIKIFI